MVLALVGAVAGFGAFEMHKHDMVGYNELKSSTDAYKASIVIASAAKAKEDRLRKGIADADLKNARSAAAVANAGWLSLAQSRATAGYLPKPTGTSDPTRATLDRAQFERTMGYLDERGQGIARQGDDQRIGLDVAKRYTQEK